MVNTRNLSRYPEPPPPGNQADLQIRGGPLYPLAEVFAVLDAGGIRPWTKTCIKDLQEQAWNNDDVIELLRNGLRAGNYRSSRWCRDNNGNWAACDDYLIHHREWNQVAHKDIDFTYYVKFAIARTGQVLLIVSCHPPRDRN